LIFFHGLSQAAKGLREKKQNLCQFNAENMLNISFSYADYQETIRERTKAFRDIFCEKLSLEITPLLKMRFLT
jgi:hypothetical protein